MMDLINMLVAARTCADDLAMEAHHFVRMQTGIGGDSSRSDVHCAARALDAALKAASRFATLQTNSPLPTHESVEYRLMRDRVLAWVAKGLGELQKKVQLIVEQVDLPRFKPRARRLQIAELLVHILIELRRLEREIATLWSKRIPPAPTNRKAQRVGRISTRRAEARA